MALNIKATPSRQGSVIGAPEVDQQQGNAAEEAGAGCLSQLLAEEEKQEVLLNLMQLQVETCEAESIGGEAWVQLYHFLAQQLSDHSLMHPRASGTLSVRPVHAIVELLSDAIQRSQQEVDGATVEEFIWAPFAAFHRLPLSLPAWSFFVPLFDKLVRRHGKVLFGKASGGQLLRTTCRWLLQEVLFSDLEGLRDRALIGLLLLMADSYHEHGSVATMTMALTLAVADLLKQPNSSSQTATVQEPPSSTLDLYSHLRPQGGPGSDSLDASLAEQSGAAHAPGASPPRNFAFFPSPDAQHARTSQWKRMTSRAKKIFSDLTGSELQNDDDFPLPGRGYWPERQNGSVEAPTSWGDRPDWRESSPPASQDQKDDDLRPLKGRGSGRNSARNSADFGAPLGELEQTTAEHNVHLKPSQQTDVLSSSLSFNHGQLSDSAPPPFISALRQSLAEAASAGSEPAALANNHLESRGLRSDTVAQRERAGDRGVASSESSPPWSSTSLTGSEDWPAAGPKKWDAVSKARLRALLRMMCSKNYCEELLRDYSLPENGLEELAGSWRWEELKGMCAVIKHYINMWREYVVAKSQASDLHAIAECQLACSNASAHVPDLRLHWLQQLSLSHLDCLPAGFAEAAQCRVAAAGIILQYLLGLQDESEWGFSRRHLSLLQRICPDMPKVSQGLLRAAAKQSPKESPKESIGAGGGGGVSGLWRSSAKGNQLEGLLPSGRGNQLEGLLPSGRGNQFEGLLPSGRGNQLEGLLPSGRGNQLEGLLPSGRGNQLEGLLPSGRSNQLEGVLPTGRGNQLEGLLNAHFSQAEIRNGLQSRKKTLQPDENQESVQETSQVSDVQETALDQSFEATWARIKAGSATTSEGKGLAEGKGLNDRNASVSDRNAPVRMGGGRLERQSSQAIMQSLGLRAPGEEGGWTSFVLGQVEGYLQVREDVAAEYLQTAGELFTAGGLFGLAAEVFEVLVALHKKRGNIKGLVRCHRGLEQVYATMAACQDAQPRAASSAESAFFLVSFHGERFGSILDGKEFVYREPRSCTTASLADKLRKAFERRAGGPNRLRLVADAALPPEGSVLPHVSVIQVLALRPVETTAGSSASDSLPPLEVSPLKLAGPFRDFFAVMPAAERNSPSSASSGPDFMRGGSPNLSPGDSPGPPSEGGASWSKKLRLRAKAWFPGLLSRLPVARMEVSMQSPWELALEEVDIWSGLLRRELEMWAERGDSKPRRSVVALLLEAGLGALEKEHVLETLLRTKHTSREQPHPSRSQSLLPLSPGLSTGTPDSHGKVIHPGDMGGGGRRNDVSQGTPRPSRWGTVKGAPHWGGSPDGSEGNVDSPLRRVSESVMAWLQDARESSMLDEHSIEKRADDDSVDGMDGVVELGVAVSAKVVLLNEIKLYLHLCVRSVKFLEEEGAGTRGRVLGEMADKIQRLSVAVRKVEPS